MTSSNYVRVIERQHPLLGRHVNHDPRSRAYDIVSPASSLKTVAWKRYAPIFDQNTQGPGGRPLGDCVANAGLGSLGTGPIYEALLAAQRIPDLQDATCVKLYAEVTAADPFPGQYPPDDTGSDGLSMAKVLKRDGMISSYRHAFSVGAALLALQTGPALLGINWYSSMFDTDASGFVVIAPGSSVVGGHEIVLDGINVESRFVTFANSWGTGWGLGGWGRMSFETLDALLKEQGDVTVPVPLSVPSPAPTPTPAPPAPAPGCSAQAFYDSIKSLAAGLGLK